MLAVSEQFENAPSFWQLPGIIFALRARVALLQDDVPAAQLALAGIGSQDDQIGLALATVITPLARCELALAQGWFEIALHISEQFIATLNNAGVRVGLAEAYYFRAQALLSQGRVTAARQSLEIALHEAENAHGHEN